MRRTRPEIASKLKDELAHMKQGFPLAPGIEIVYVIRDARKWEVDPKRTASKFDAAYYRGLLEKAWAEAAFVFAWISKETCQCESD